MSDERNCEKCIHHVKHPTIEGVLTCEKWECEFEALPTIAIKGMEMPTNCAECPCLYTDYKGWHCGTKIGEGKEICQDSLYFPQRPKWCPLIEV